MSARRTGRPPGAKGRADPSAPPRATAEPPPPAAAVAPAAPAPDLAAPDDTKVSFEGWGIKIEGNLALWLRRLWRGRWRLLGLALLLLVIAAGVLYLWFLSAPLDNARAALRLARYDTALAALDPIPSRLARWPGLDALRAKAQLGLDLHTPPQDWQALGIRLRALRTRAPGDADLMVMDATLAMHREAFAGAAATLGDAVIADPRNAEAWFLLGLVRDLAGDKQKAIGDYRQAAALAPESPQYGSNLARVLLDQGDAAAAVAQYRRLGGFPLARIEQALGHWALGQWREAAQAQGEALALLDDQALMARPSNRLGWRFALTDRPPPDDGVHLANAADKRCYALLGQAVSLRLAGGTAPLPGCPEAHQDAIRTLVADDLCRFVDRDPLARKAAVGPLRRALGQPATCPAPEAARPPGAPHPSA